MPAATVVGCSVTVVPRQMFCMMQTKIQHSTYMHCSFLISPAESSVFPAVVMLESLGVTVFWLESMANDVRL